MRGTELAFRSRPRSLGAKGLIGAKPGEEHEASPPCWHLTSWTCLCVVAHGCSLLWYDLPSSSPGRPHGTQLDQIPCFWFMLPTKKQTNCCQLRKIMFSKSVLNSIYIEDYFVADHPIRSLDNAIMGSVCFWCTGYLAVSTADTPSKRNPLKYSSPRQAASRELCWPTRSRAWTGGRDAPVSRAMPPGRLLERRWSRSVCSWSDDMKPEVRT